MRRLVLLLLVATALVSAGCLGGSGGSSVQTQGTHGSQAPDTGMNSSMNKTHAPAFAWNHTQKKGTVQAVSVPLVGTLSYASNVSQNWTVASGAKNLTLNLTTKGGDVQVNIYPPGCQPSNTGMTPPCASQANTTGGSLSWSTVSPAAGRWQIDLFPTNAGQSSVDYTLDIGILQPVTSS